MQRLHLRYDTSDKRTYFNHKRFLLNAVAFGANFSYIIVYVNFILGTRGQKVKILAEHAADYVGSH